MPKGAFDFYNDINKKWLDENSIPADLVSYGGFDILEKNIRSEIVKIIKSNHGSNSEFGLFINSIFNGRDNDIVLIDAFIHSLKINSYEELFRVFGKLNLYKLRSPIEFAISNDSRDTDRYVVIITEQERLIDKKDYLEKNLTYKKYSEFLKTLSSKIGISSKELLDFETVLASSYFDNEESSVIEKVYNPKTYHQIIREYPLLKELFDVIKRPFEKLIVINPQLLEKTYRTITNISILKWKGIIRLNVYLSVLSLLPEPFLTMNFNFRDKFLIGRKQRISKDGELFEICNELCPDTIGNIYIESQKKRFSLMKDEGSRLLDSVKKAARKKVLGLAWLSESSRKIAIFKIEKMKSRMAFPTVWLNEFREKIDPNCFMKNLLILKRSASEYEFKKLDPNYRRSELWDNPCYDVNAYYYTELNLLCIPIGFLGAPFFSLEQSFLENLAGLGNIMAHELAHGFDEEGRKYDEKGNYRPWWVSTDIEMYNSKTRQLVEFYNKESYFGKKINGELTLGENLADLGAMAICLEVLKERHQEMDKKTRLKELREFFTWYAKSWAYKETAEKRDYAMKTDSHAPAKTRVNAIVRQFNEFYEAFNLKEGDDGFIEESERIDIWG